MTVPKPFRFGVSGTARSRKEWIAHAQGAENLGYSTLIVGDHPALGGFAPLPALLLAAEATTSLRFGTHVLNNDLRHPAMLAHEAATFDVLTGGRLELGIGAGWLGLDYHALGLEFDRPGIRLARLDEAIPVMKQILQGASATYTGDYYQINELNLNIAPVQTPHLPIFIGGGSRRILGLAARQANIVGLDLRSSGGVMDLNSYTAAAMDEQVGWVREAAGSRFDELELHTLVHVVEITDNRQRGAEQILEFIESARKMGMLNEAELTIEDVFESPHLLFGTVAQIVDDLQLRRERYGISYITLLQGEHMELFAPIVEQLAGR